MFHVGVNLQATGRKGRVRPNLKVSNCMSKKPFPILYIDLLHKMAVGQDFLDVQNARHK